jgi:hypothetical protein
MSCWAEALTAADHVATMESTKLDVSGFGQDASVPSRYENGAGMPGAVQVES